MKSRDEKFAAIVCDALALQRGPGHNEFIQKQTNINQPAGFDESRRSVS